MAISKATSRRNGGAGVTGVAGWRRRTGESGGAGGAGENSRNPWRLAAALAQPRRQLGGWRSLAGLAKAGPA